MVWTEILRLLEDPRLIHNELERRLSAAREADQQNVTTRRSDVTWCVCKGLIGRSPLIRKVFFRLRTARANAGAATTRTGEQCRTTGHHRSDNHPRSLPAPRETLNTFLTRLRSSASDLNISERQRIMRLLVKEVLVGDDKIIIRHPSSFTQPIRRRAPLTAA